MSNRIRSRDALRAAKATLQRFSVPERLEVDALRTLAAEVHGKPIRRVEVDHFESPQVCAILATCHDAPFSQLKIRRSAVDDYCLLKECHEYAHVLLGQTSLITIDSLMASLREDSSNWVARAYGGEGTIEELSAETLGRMIFERIQAGRTPSHSGFGKVLRAHAHMA